MATTIVDTDGTSGDYASLSAWEAAEQADLVTTTTSIVVQCRATTSVADTTQLFLAGWTTSATFNATIENHADDYHGGVWDTGIYRLSVDSFSIRAIETSFAGGMEDLTVRGIQIENAKNSGRGIYLNETNDFLIAERLILRNTHATPIAGARGISATRSAQIHVSNCFFYDQDAGIEITSGIGESYIHNNTVRNCVSGYDTLSANVRVTNNIAAGCTDGFVGTFHGDSNFNASDGAAGDAPGASSQNEVTFTFVGADDPHLADTDAGALDLGTDLSAHGSYAVTVDIDNVTRTGTWDIGADAETAAAGGRRFRQVCIS